MVLRDWCRIEDKEIKVFAELAVFDGKYSIREGSVNTGIKQEFQS